MKPNSRSTLALAVAALVVGSVAPRTAAAALAPGETSFDVAPRVAHMVKPEYPEPARSQGVEGIVRLSLVVAADGTPGAPEVVKQVEGHPELADAAAKAVAQWLFEPATKDGRAVDARIVIPIRFQLEGRTKKSEVAPDGR